MQHHKHAAYKQGMVESNRESSSTDVKKSIHKTYTFYVRILRRGRKNKTREKRQVHVACILLQTANTSGFVYVKHHNIHERQLLDRKKKEQENHNRA